MLADSEAMFVDALTYLFNLLAERLKHRAYIEKEKRMPADVRHYRRRLTRLYLELIPPFISVSTLVVVTIFALRDSMSVLLGDYPTDPGDQPDINIMMIFSAVNLALDVVNVMCFARADQAVGLQTREHMYEAHHHPAVEAQGSPPERTPLTSTYGGQAYSRTGDTDSETNFSDDTSQVSSGHNPLNLNMCSAWMVRDSSLHPIWGLRLVLAFYC